jgi:hypothetical protein
MSVSLVAPSSAVARPSLRLLPRQSSDSESLEIDIADPNHVLQADFPLLFGEISFRLLPCYRRIGKLDRDAPCDTRMLVTSERDGSSFY